MSINTTPKVSDKSVLVISNLPSYEGKVKRHLNPLAQACNDVTIVCPTTHESIDSEKYSNITIHEVPVESKLFSRFIELFLALIVCLRGDYDTIITISLYPHGIYGLLVGAICRVPVHLRIIGADIPVHSRSWYLSLTFALFLQFDSIAVHGTNHKRFLINNGISADRIHVVPGSVDIEIYKKDTMQDKKYDFLWLAGIKSHKRPEMFVRSLSILRDRGVEFQAVMVGSGPREESVDRLICSKGLSEVIDRPGWVDVTETPRYYTSSRIFVMTSEREAFGYPLVEAMASGLACVAPKFNNLANGNTSYILTHMEDGILVPEMSPETLAEQLEILVTNETLQGKLSKNAAESSRRFSQESMRARWVNVVGDLVQ